MKEKNRTAVSCEEVPQIPSEAAYMSVCGVGLAARLGEFRDLYQLIKDAVVRHLHEHNVNFDVSRGFCVDPIEGSSDGVNFAVHVAINGEHEVVQVMVSHSELELHERIPKAGEFGVARHGR